MRILIATTQVPFVRGGAEIHAEQLCAALERAGHQAEIAAIPFKWYPPDRIVDNMLACRLLDVTESCGNIIDRVIGLKFPAYLIPHPNKVLWILHQHRSAYDLWGGEYCDLMHDAKGSQVRSAIVHADKKLIPEAKAVYANSANVAKRLKQFCGLTAEPLYHPPQHADLFYCKEDEGYLFYPSRLSVLKRQELVVQALAKTTRPVRVVFAGAADTAPYAASLRELGEKLGVASRIEWLGHVTEDEKRNYYARSRGVIFTPVDEDYGYITLEAMLSSKAVITCNDSGGPLEFVRYNINGLVADPTPDALATAFDELWVDADRARLLGKAGRELYDSMKISWDTVLEKLLS